MLDKIEEREKKIEFLEERIAEEIRYSAKLERAIKEMKRKQENGSEK